MNLWLPMSSFEHLYLHNALPSLKSSRTLLRLLNKGVSALEPDSIQIDSTLQSTSYETGSINFDRVRTTNLTRCDRAQFPLCVHVTGRAFFKKSSSSEEMLFGCFFIRCYVFAEKKTTKSFGVGTLDHKESRKKTEAASGGDKVPNVRIVVSINTHSVRDEQCVRLSQSSLQEPLDILHNRILPTKQIVTW